MAGSDDLRPADRAHPVVPDFPGRQRQVRYAESPLIGYRWYDTRRLPVLFPFGHGLSYTSFKVGSPVLASASVPVGTLVTVALPVTNTGDRRGSHVVQCYVRPHASRLVRPDKEPEDVRQGDPGPGASTTVTLTLGERPSPTGTQASPSGPSYRRTPPPHCPNCKTSSDAPKPAGPSGPAATTS